MSVTALHLGLLPWALGAVHAWSQLMSLGLAAAGFLLAALPRSGQSPAVRLWRWPVFWAGLALMGYIALQGLNPAWRFTSDSDQWWLEPLAHVSWLPAGVAVPFAQSGPWRALVVFASLWLLVCSVWAGFLRRKSYRLLFTFLVVNACFLALLGALQALSGTKKIFWLYVPSNGSFCASFIYPNHAGAYLNLMVALAVGLTWWHHLRGRQRLEKPGAAASFMLAAAGIGLMVIFSYSRMSIVLLLVFTAGTGGVLAFRLGRQPGPVRRRPEFLPLTLALAALLCFGGVVLRTEKV